MILEGIDKIVSIREMRQDRAGRELKTRKQILEHSKQREINQKQKLEGWKEQIPIKEKNIFSEVKDKKINRKALEDMRSKIGLLHEHAHKLEEIYAQAKKKKEEDSVAVDSAHKDYRKATKSKRKIEEVDKIIKNQQQKEALRKEDLEMEEFKTKKISY